MTAAAIGLLGIIVGIVGAAWCRDNRADRLRAQRDHERNRADWNAKAADHWRRRYENANAQVQWHGGRTGGAS